MKRITLKTRVENRLHFLITKLQLELSVKEMKEKLAHGAFDADINESISYFIKVVKRVRSQQTK